MNGLPGNLGAGSDILGVVGYPWSHDIHTISVARGSSLRGRGRAKAKQAKVARDLKYRSFDTNFDELQRELHGDSGDEIPEQYSDLAKKFDDPAAS